MDKMRQAFERKAKQAVKKIKPISQPLGVSTVGAELELFLYKIGERGTRELATHAEKEAISQGIECAGTELGAAAVELHPGPVDISTKGLGALYQQLRGYELELSRNAARAGFTVGRSGTISWADVNRVERTPLPKYKHVPDFHWENRREGFEPSVGGVWVSDPGVVGLLNSFQFTMQARDVSDAIDKTNRLFMISPMAVALFANACVLGNVDTGWADVRLEVWRRSHDVRVSDNPHAPERVGLPFDYYRDIQAYFDDIAQFPFILDAEEHALQIGIGLLWRDVRIKFPNGHVLVEFRPLSTQGSLETEMLATAFTIGRLLWSQKNNEPLLPMKLVRSNKNQAEKFGLEGQYFSADRSYVPMREALRAEIQKASIGLEALPNDAFMELTQSRLHRLLDRQKVT